MSHTPLEIGVKLGHKKYFSSHLSSQFEDSLPDSLGTDKYLSEPAQHFDHQTIIMNPETTAAMEKSSTFREAVETDVEVPPFPPSSIAHINSSLQSHDGREEQLLSYILTRPDLEQLQGSPTKLLAAIDEFSKTHAFLISIGGHKAGILADLIAREKPRIVLELGGYLGYSAIVFADAMRRAYGSSEGLRIWSIEMSDECANIATRFIELAGLADIVTVVRGTAKEMLRKLKVEETVKGVDMLFLDHSEDLYVSDFRVCVELGLLGKGAVIAADNVVRPGAPEYREFIRTFDGVVSEGVRGLIQPGDYEVSRIVEMSQEIANFVTG